MTGSGFQDRRERAVLAGLHPSPTTVAIIRNLVAPLTVWPSLETSKRNLSHLSIAVLNLRGVGNDVNTRDERAAAKPGFVHPFIRLSKLILPRLYSM